MGRPKQRRSRHIYREPVLPSFALVMSRDYPALLPALFPVPRGTADARNFDTDSTIEFAQEDSDDDDVFVYTVDDERDVAPPALGSRFRENWEVEDRAVAEVEALRDDAADDTFERLHEALHPGAPSPPLSVLLRRRMSTLVLDLAVKVIGKLRTFP